MTVETFTAINSLDPTLPSNGDPRAEGPAHLRGIKSTLKTTFPSVTGPTSATQADLSAVADLRANGARRDTAQTFAGDQTVNGRVYASTSVDAPQVLQNGAPLVRNGIIALWAGAIADIPAGWALCNGSNGTPDMRNLFVVCAGGSYAVGATGGAAAIDTLTSAGGAHSHTGITGAAGAHAHSVTVALDGSHSHGGATGSHGLTVDELPPHVHTFPGGTAGGASASTAAGGGTGVTVTANQTNAAGSGNGHTHSVGADGLHSHAASAVAVPDHAHVIAADGNHQHEYAFDNRPPFIALAYIMKL